MMQTRLLQAHDFERWNILWQQYLDFYQVRLPETTTEATWQRLIDEQETNMHAIGVFVDDVLQGFAHVVIHPNTWSDQPCAYLEDLCVDQNHRQQGQGRILIEAAQQFAIQRQCCRLYWVTQRDNHQAQKLYDKVATQTDFIQYRIDLTA